MYYETTEVTDKDGNVVDTVQGIPTLKYYRRSLKSEYRTEKVTMAEAMRRGDLTLATVDEVGRWLPRPDSKYRNEEYYRMKNTNPAQFNLANKMSSLDIPCSIRAFVPSFTVVYLSIILDLFPNLTYPLVSIQYFPFLLFSVEPLLPA
jgi:hypothetical protein